MRFFLVVIAIIANEVIRQANGDNYTYEINARRTGEYIYHQNRIFDLDPEVEIVWHDTMQRGIYKENINRYFPFEIISDVKHGANTIYTNDGRLNSCKKLKDDSWDYVIIEMVDKGLMPDGKCPVKAGDYFIFQKVDPISVTFDKMLQCGDYTLWAFLIWRNSDVGYVIFKFNIPDDGNCIPK